MNDNNPIEYSPYFVAFLDILGFRNLVFGDQKEKINTYFTLINEITNDLKSIPNKKNIGSITISDSVILSIPFDDNDLNITLSNFRQLCIAIQKIQFKLALNNVWMRGAVSFGDACFKKDENQIVGKAYIDAYELEKTAIYPRVVVDSRLIEKLGFESSSKLIDKINNFNIGHTEFEATERNILFWWNYNYGQRRQGLSYDVPLFIDYLVYAFESEKYLTDIINNIRENIYSGNNIYSKYRWVTDYLLMLCEFQNTHGNKIDKEIIQREHQRLLQL